nr:unnamed protein product [Callosobruchus chinensis]
MLGCFPKTTANYNPRSVRPRSPAKQSPAARACRPLVHREDVFGSRLAPIGSFTRSMFSYAIGCC